MHNPINIDVLLSIPEFQYILASFLVDYVEERDLKSCQLVSRSWREVFTPHLWKVRSLGVLAPRGRYETAEAQKTLQRIGRHIRHVRVCEVQSLSAVLPFCPNITTLAVDAPLAESMNGSWMELVACIYPCKKLETLAIRHWAGSSLAKLVPDLSRMMAHRLRHIAVSTDPGVDCSSSALLDLLIGLPRLTSLCLSTAEGWRIDHDATLLRRHQFKLRSLEVNNHELLFALWRQCPLIEKFDFSNLHIPSWMHSTVMDEIVSLFDLRDDHNQPVRPVETLRLPLVAEVQDGQLARILQGCVPNHLTELDVHNCAVGNQTFKILFETQRESLERLVLYGWVVQGANPSPWIQRILSSCPQLRKLWLLWDGSDNAKIVWLHVNDLIESPWVCRRLASFQVPIVGIPNSLNGEEAQQMVDRVMRQIGSMERLQSFGTGFHSDLSSMVLKDTLPFSLGAGGLQHLAALKRLEVLNVTRCAHRIRYPEARWMGEHWPKLREVNGLDRLWENSTTHPAQWLRSSGVYVPIS